LGPLFARAPMSDDEEIHLHVTYVTHMDMDEAFRACMRIAIAAGLESAPIGVVTTPGTQNPKYVTAKMIWPLSSSSGDINF
jgi:hypothetical protein